MEALKMLLALTDHYKQLEYFNRYWEDAYLKAFSDPTSVIRLHCMEQLPVTFIFISV